MPLDEKDSLGAFFFCSDGAGTEYIEETGHLTSDVVPVLDPAWASLIINSDILLH